MIYGHVWSRSDTFSPTIILGGARVQLNSRFHHLQPGSSNDKHCTTRYGEVFMTFSRGGKKITSGCSNLGIFFVYLPKIVEHKPINNLDSFFLVIFYRLYHGKSPSNHRENPRMMMCFSLGKLKVISSVGNVSFAIVLSLFFCAYFLHVENIPLWFLRVSLVFLVIPSCRACISLGKGERAFDVLFQRNYQFTVYLNWFFVTGIMETAASTNSGWIQI